MKPESEEIWRRFGQNLRRHRQAAELSQAQLAARSPLSIGTVSRLERGRQEPELPTVYFLAGSLGIRPGDLLAGVGWSPEDGGHYWVGVADDEAVER